VQVIGSSTFGRAQAFRDLMDWGSDLEPVIGDTPARQLQRDNQAAIVQLVNLTASAELVRCLAGMTFVSYEDAVAARDDAADRLDALALRQADAGDDDGAEQYDALRRAMTADLTARGGTLARLRAYTPATTEPALVIAQRLYGEPATLIERAEEIIARNKVAHPGFVTGGVPLQVLSAEGNANG
jgi:prophage DNA circulation protein